MNHGEPLSFRRPVPKASRWSRLGLGVAVVVTAIIGAALPASTRAWTANTFNSTSESQMVQLHNQARANAGLGALVVDSTLHAKARERSKDMIVRDYFSHSIPPDGHKVFDELKAAGYCYVTAGENIGWNSWPDAEATQQMFSMWMGSSGHKSNILGKTWDVIGVGAYQGTTDKKMWTVLFAQSCSSNPTPAPTATPAPTTPPTSTPKPTAAPTSTPKPTAAPTSTPKPTTPPTSTPTPTSAPTLEPTPEPTSEPSPTAAALPTSQLPELSPDPFYPAWMTTDPVTVPPPSGEPSPTLTPAPLAGDAGLRVVDPPVFQGLLEAIVGGITGLFFGS